MRGCFEEMFVKFTNSLFFLLFTVCVLILSFQTDFGQEQSKTVEQRKPIICSDCDNLNQTALSLPKPEYPLAAKAVRASGDVGVSVLIDENGNVIEAKAVSGHPLLRAAAVKAALQAKFRPVTIGGKPFRGYGLITYKFTLDDSQPKENSQQEVPTEKVRKVKIIVDLGGGTITGKAVKLSKPPFPTNCRCKFSKNLKTVVQFTVDEKGNVESAVGISGHPLLRAVSIAAIRNSKFIPSLVDNSPVKAYGTIIYDFAKRKTRIVKYELKLER